MVSNRTITFCLEMLFMALVVTLISAIVAEFVLPIWNPTASFGARFFCSLSAILSALLILFFDSIKESVGIFVSEWLHYHRCSTCGSFRYRITRGYGVSPLVRHEEILHKRGCCKRCGTPRNYPKSFVPSKVDLRGFPVDRE